MIEDLALSGHIEQVHRRGCVWKVEGSMGGSGSLAGDGVFKSLLELESGTDLRRVDKY